MAACSRARTGRWSTWRTSAAITRSTRSPAGCSTSRRRGRQDFLHHRPADLRDGDQDRAHGHPDPDFALGLHRLGRRACAQGELTLIGRARGKRFVALAGEDRIVFDQDLAYVEEESAKHRRKAAMHDE